jgi:hypothetical protein
MMAHVQYYILYKIEGTPILKLAMAKRLKVKKLVPKLQRKMGGKWSHFHVANLGS